MTQQNDKPFWQKIVESGKIYETNIDEDEKIVLVSLIYKCGHTVPTLMPAGEYDYKKAYAAHHDCSHCIVTRGWNADADDNA